MRKFTLIFVLFVLTISFVAMYFFFMVAKNIPQRKIDNQASTEATLEEEMLSGEDLGPSVYEDYTKELYDKALSENRVVVLYFTANWCPICRDQEPVNVQVFDELTTEGVVGLRVHILDSETTDETNALAQKFDVIYQHTFVILDTNGAVDYHYTGPQEKELIISKIRSANKQKEEVNEATVSGEVEE